MFYNPLPLVIFFAGLYFLFKLRFFFVFHPIRTLRLAFDVLKDKRARASLFLALAGTLGVGNIFGVAVGIIIGGAGSVFWIVLSSVFSSALKYAEVTLTLDCKETVGYGPAFSGVLKSLGGASGRSLSAVYTIATLALSLIMGGAMQSGAATALCTEYFGVGTLVVSVFFCLLLIFAIIGKRSRISRITELLIPVATVLYILLSACALGVNCEKIPSAVTLIFKEAFTPSAVGGGAVGFLFSTAVREGFSRGMLSNEAGAGTSASAHIDSGIEEPGKAGVMGIIEVFFDTTLLCTLTGLVILTSVEDLSKHKGGMELVYHAFVGALGNFSGLLLTSVVFVFAYSTVICWYYYGTRAARGLLGRTGGAVFLPFFLGFCLFGGFIKDGPLIILTDLAMLVLGVICTYTLIKSSDRIKALSERCGLLKSGVSDKTDTG